jgi:hypothetical protein
MRSISVAQMPALAEKRAAEKTKSANNFFIPGTSGLVFEQKTFEGYHSGVLKIKGLVFIDLGE